MTLVAERLEEPVAIAPITDEAPRCWQCGRTMAEYLTRPWSLRCPRCKAPNCRGEHPSKKAA